MPPIPTSLGLIIIQICLGLAGAIGLFGGVVQMRLGQPDTSPRLDNVHRFMAGIYLGTGFICWYAAWTAAQQGALIDLLALGILLGGIGRLISMRKVGLPEPKKVWLGYLTPELLLPVIIVLAHHVG
jgi:hypothetical protein